VVTNSVLQTTLAQTGKEHIGNVFLAGLSVPDGPSLDDIPRSLLDAYSVEGNTSKKIRIWWRIQGEFVP